MKGPYIYHNFEVDRVIDGDTVVLSIDKGFFDWRRKRKDGVSYRLHRINAYEINKPKGPAAKQALVDYMPIVVAVETIPDPNQDPKLDKYGRFVLELTASVGGTEFNVNDALVEGGHAVYKAY